jgi:TrmH family RNA methyltransferase
MPMPALALFYIFGKKTGMLTNNKIKLIKSLEFKKFRKQYQAFVVEGEKMLLELLESNYTIQELYVTEAFFQKYQHTHPKLEQALLLSEAELKKASQLQTATHGLAVVEMNQNQEINLNPKDLYLALDNIQDPGNLGTLIRTALWFGVETIFCSPDTVDVYNPKVIQATMGAVFKIQVIYSDLNVLVQQARIAKLPLMGTQLNGNNIYTSQVPKNGIIFMGNESKGLSDELAEMLDLSLKIPAFPEQSNRMESLNVSVAAALVLAEFRRQIIEPKN